MTNADWEKKFGKQFLITLTNEERKCLGLSNLSPDWDALIFCSKTNVTYTRVTAFFDGNTIIKVISETKKASDDGTVNYSSYVEDDTKLETVDRKQLLPLTSRGKPKPLSASNINAVTPFGCSFALSYWVGEDTGMWLNHPRANKYFPIGEKDATAAIRSDADFHAFMEYYISTCREDYFSKLQAFKEAKKVTVKYQPGDIFRMELDRTHYCYGIITGTVKQMLAMPELPKKHSLRQLMMVPIMVRAYQLITEDPNLTAADLRQIPLGRLDIAGDNDIIWGTHTIVDHKPLTPDDLEFDFVCTKIKSRSPHNTLFTQDMLMRDGLIPQQEYSLYIEWGFAQTSLRYDQLSDRLKSFLAEYSSPHGGVRLCILPENLVPNEKQRKYPFYRNNLLNPQNREMRNEIFACLGLNEDTTFDQFAEKFGGLTRQEIISLMK
ncbi:MAG: immunity 26/phosphotriesterase HocA family protein [Oscillospiraceae bacterium]|nr:immunity 26/phosphotriesterase HocA family protein [Oscillospiraceae bacterium]